jgi:putative acetyltransferase
MSSTLAAPASSTVRVANESPDQPDVLQLIAELDAYQQSLYPAESNHLLDVSALLAPNVRFAVARGERGEALGCVAVVLMEGFAEIKRMFVSPRSRGGGVGRRLLDHVEAQALGDGLRVLRLETGIHQPEALGLYERAGYARRGPYEGYAEDPLSVFMEKVVGT